MPNQYVPVYPDYIRMQLVRRRKLADGQVQQKLRRANAEQCPACYGQPKDRDGRYPSCDGCTWGLVVGKPAAACCCQGPADERCSGCADAHGLVHVCLVDSDEEIDYELGLTTGPRAGKNRASEKTRARAAAMEQNTRMGQ